MFARPAKAESRTFLKCNYIVSQGRLFSQSNGISWFWFPLREFYTLIKGYLFLLRVLWRKLSFASSRNLSSWQPCSANSWSLFMDSVTFTTGWQWMVQRWFTVFWRAGKHAASLGQNGSFWKARYRGCSTYSHPPYLHVFKQSSKEREFITTFLYLNEYNVIIL